VILKRFKTTTQQEIEDAIGSAELALLQDIHLADMSESDLMTALIREALKAISAEFADKREFELRLVQGLPHRDQIDYAGLNQAFRGTLTHPQQLVWDKRVQGIKPKDMNIPNMDTNYVNLSTWIIRNKYIKWSRKINQYQAIIDKYPDLCQSHRDLLERLIAGESNVMIAKSKGISYRCTSQTLHYCLKSHPV
jgi:hypothetical protein